MREIPRCLPCGGALPAHLPGCIWRPVVNHESEQQLLDDEAGRPAWWRELHCVDCHSTGTSCRSCWCHRTEEDDTVTDVLRSGADLPMT